MSTRFPTNGCLCLSFELKPEFQSTSSHPSLVFPLEDVLSFLTFSFFLEVSPQLSPSSCVFFDLDLELEDLMRESSSSFNHDSRSSISDDSHVATNGNTGWDNEVWANEEDDEWQSLDIGSSQNKLK
jgi:hypothetical protein